MVADIIRAQQDAASSGHMQKEKYVIPPHLHDLQESDLPETQRGLVISEIAQFRERAAKREREKLRDVQASIPVLAPSGPKTREWGKAPATSASNATKPPHNYAKSGFVKGDESNAPEFQSTPAPKTDEELENDRKEARRKEEENSFKDVRLSLLLIDCRTNVILEGAPV
jgi:hypothetical protein